MKVYLDNCCFNRPFDYTEWQKDLYRGETVASLFDKVRAFEKLQGAVNF